MAPSLLRRAKKFFELAPDPGIDRREQSGAQKYDKQRGKCRDTRNQVFEELDKSMRGSREETKFICRDDVKQAWSGTDSVSKALFPGKFKIEDLRRIMQDYILVLSILTFIGAHDILDRFEEHFLGEATQRRCDENLPFLDEDLDFFTDLASRGKFKASQYLFIPEEISESEFQNTQVIDPLKRLPFEHVSDAAFKGGYADVKEVTISPRYFKDNNRHSNDEPKVVACKQLRMDKDFRKEVETLELLKESITPQPINIMLHLATIIHGENFYILLPFARYYNLEIFLHEGEDIYSAIPHSLYVFQDTFPDYKLGNIGPLLEQSYNLALALKWLHYDLHVLSNHSAQMHCAHMDLKPDNILIDFKSDAVVGQWKLCDFGISVIHDRSESEKPEYASVGDLYMLAERKDPTTIRAEPPRGRGTYQAPEIKAGGQRVGRRSDVWSFVCILSVVFTFALQGKKGVEDFQEMRCDGPFDYVDDGFYQEKAAGRLAPPGVVAEREYVLRPGINQWLEELLKYHGHEKGWVKTGVDLVRTFLEPNHNNRKTSVDLVEELDSMMQPFRRSAEVESERSRSRHQPYSPVAPQLGGFVRQPELIVDPGPSRPLVVPTQELRLSITQDSEEPTSPAKSDKYEKLGSDRSTGHATSNYMTSLTDLTSRGIPVKGLGSQDSEPEVIRLTVAIEDRKASTGLFGMLKESQEIKAVAASERFLAFLVTGSECFISAYSMNLDSCSLSGKADTFSLKENGWAKLFVAGDYLVAWGNTRSGFQLLHASSVPRLQKSIEIPSHIKNESLNHIALSCRGIVALICHAKIHFLSINPQQPSPDPYPIPHSVYTTAAFSDDGSILFIWALGRPNDNYLGLAFNDGKTTLLFTKGYQSSQRGRTEYGIIPSTTIQSQGCIIQSPDRQFFVRDPAMRPDELSSNYHVSIPKAIAGCIFDNEYLITLEAASGNPRIVQCHTMYDGKRAIDRGGRSIVFSLSKHEHKASDLRIFRHKNSIVLLILGLSNKVTFLKFEDGVQ